jgi:gluconate 5-dehydrogenase
VILNGTRKQAVADAVAALDAKLPAAQRGSTPILGRAFNVTDEAAVGAAFEHWDSEGIAVDIFVNNAGIPFRQPLVDLKLADWQRVIDTNLTAAFIVGREAARRMIARRTGGKIVNIGSLTSEAARATVGAYTAAKGGIKMLTRAMSAEWAAHDIQANAIGPGYMLTDMNATLVANASFDAWVKGSNPAQRWGKAEELVGTAVYLSSAASSYVNRQIIYFDGGWLAVL